MNQKHNSPHCTREVHQVPAGQGLLGTHTMDTSKQPHSLFTWAIQPCLFKSISTSGLFNTHTANTKSRKFFTSIKIHLYEALRNIVCKALKTWQVLIQEVENKSLFNILMSYSSRMDCHFCHVAFRFHKSNKWYKKDYWSDLMLQKVLGSFSWTVSWGIWICYFSDRKEFLIFYFVL